MVTTAITVITRILRSGPKVPGQGVPGSVNLGSLCFRGLLGVSYLEPAPKNRQQIKWSGTALNEIRGWWLEVLCQLGRHWRWSQAVGCRHPGGVGRNSRPLSRPSKLCLRYVLCPELCRKAHLRQLENFPSFTALLSPALPWPEGHPMQQTSSGWASRQEQMRKA